MDPLLLDSAHPPVLPVMVANAAQPPVPAAGAVAE